MSGNLSLGGTFLEPERLPVAGGPTTSTFRALHDGGGGRLRAEYEITRPEAYRFAGGSDTATMAARAVSGSFRDFNKSLRLSKVAGGPRLLFLSIDLTVQEVDAGGADVGDPEEGVFQVEFPGGVNALRVGLGVSQQSLADMLGVPRSTLAGWEAGRSPSNRNRGKLPASVEDGLALFG